MKIDYQKLEKKIDIKFKNKELLIRSLTHKSFNKFNNNEKLEFLGDRVLGLIMAKRLLEIYPDEKEGILDKKFASLGNKKTCLEISKKLELEKFKEIGVVKRGRSLDYEQLWTFQQEINQMLRRQEWTKTEILDALQRIVPNFLHLDLNKNLSDAI